MALAITRGLLPFFASLDADGLLGVEARGASGGKPDRKKCNRAQD